jgi:anti-sigma factor RsiW
MPEAHDDFDEALLSGYVDGELTQGDAQRVRLRMERDPEVRATVEELQRIKEATMGSDFRLPPDGSWDEAPRSRASRLLRNAGFIVGIGLLLALVVTVLVALLDEESLIGLLFVGGFLVAGGLLLASVLIDRREDIKNDKYRRVKK